MTANSGGYAVLMPRSPAQAVSGFGASLTPRLASPVMHGPAYSGANPTNAPSGFYDGACKITGSTTYAGTPYRARVYLYPQDAPTLCIASADSGTAGTFSFTKLRAGNYIAIAIDPTGTYDAVIHALIATVGM
jgi:hypothetical protein